MGTRHRRTFLLAAFALPGFALLSALAAAGRKAAPAPRVEMVGPGVLSTPLDESGAAFTADGRTVYFTLRSPTTTSQAVLAICVSHFAHGRWSEPEVAPFSGRYNDLSPSLSPDGRRLIFTSDRPVPGRAAAPRDNPDYDLWEVERQGEGWSEPRNLGTPIDTPENSDSSGVLAADGTLYFSSSRPGGQGSLDLYRARRQGDGYAAPEPLTAINSPGYEGQPALSPDGSTLVFVGLVRPDATVGSGHPYAKTDLYVSFRTEDGGWSAPRNLGPPINTTASDYAPSFSPDGRWLYFTSERSFAHLPVTPPMTAAAWAAKRTSLLSGTGNLYRVEARALRALAPAPGPPPYAAAGALPTPRLFAPGIVSTSEDEYGGAFDPDGRTVYFDRSVPRSQLYTIFTSRFVGGAWTRPQVAPFSGSWRDSDPVLSPQGDRLYFVSDRPRGGQEVADYDIWVARRGPGGWGQPTPLGAPVNSAGDEYFISETRDGTLYFTSNRPGSQGAIDAWRARFTGNGYAEPEHLGPTINSPDWTTIEAYVAPDESFLLIGAWGHAEGAGDCDLFASYRQGNGWSKLQPLRGVNTEAREYSPRITPDGRYLIYASEKGTLTQRPDRPLTHRELTTAIQSIENGLGNLYQVDLVAVLPPKPPAEETVPKAP